MSTTVFTQEVRKDDIVDFGGQPIAVAANAVTRWGQVEIPVWDGDKELRPAVKYLYFPIGAPLNVQRPDPDKELVEFIAKRLHALDADRGYFDEGEVWDELETDGSDMYLIEARETVNAYREFNA